MITTEEQEKELVENYPHMPVVIKWAKSMRSLHFIKDVAGAIKEKMDADPKEYPREIYIACENLDKLRSALGIPDKYGPM